MGLSTALSNAVSGLQVSSRIAELISGNISNAMTPGYARNEADISAAHLNGQGDGVRIDDVRRVEDLAATLARRRIDAEHGSVSVRSEAASRIADALGEPGSPGALATKYGEMEAALVFAANSPESETGLRDLAARADDLARTFNTVSQRTAEIRQNADFQIGQTVDRMNRNLIRVDELNDEIAKRHGAVDTTGLETERQRLIDEISDIVPLKVIKRERGQLALFSENGASLLDYYRSEFAFSPTAMITHDMSVGLGSLSQLTMNGTPLDMVSQDALMAGGSLAAHFFVRDEAVPAFNTQFDGLARDLVERFQDTAVDTTLAVGDPGLFTDGGAAFLVANQIGLAGRLSLNTAVDAGSPTIWKLRDGINSAVQGDVGNNTILRNLEEAMKGARASNTSLSIVATLGATDFASELTSQHALIWSSLDSQSSYTATQQAALIEAESARTGVDTDQQLQMLMDIEKAYAANARVISVADAMLARLLEI